jgi:hypothetical protein
MGNWQRTENMRTRVAEVHNLMSGIYLSYRRMDAAGHVGHRFDPLSRLLAQESIFSEGLAGFPR